MKVKGAQSMMYLAHPTRIWKEYGSERMMQFARKKGFAPVNPFLCGDFKDFEGGIVGREGTLDWTLYLQRGCYWSGYFGISEGVMRELQDRLKWDKEKRMRVFHEDDKGEPFDEKWEQEYEVLKNKYGDLLAELRGDNYLIALVGPSAVGKTYAIEKLISEFGSKLKRVKNVTTRPPRDDQDKKYYYLVTKDQFLERMHNSDFLEHDEYLDNYYGSSLDKIKQVLRQANGIFAITPRGAEELYKCRFEINVLFVILQPESDAVLKQNLERRGILDKQKQLIYIEKAKDFKLPESIPHQILKMTSTKSDKQRILDLLGPFLK